MKQATGKYLKKMRVIDFYDKPDNLKIPIKLSYQPLIKGGRTFTVSEDIKVKLSDGFEIVIKDGTITDMASVPNFYGLCSHQ